jgi:hypothetical protein
MNLPDHLSLGSQLFFISRPKNIQPNDISRNKIIERQGEKFEKGGGVE